jgi:DNA-binding protein HU-beta
VSGGETPVRSQSYVAVDQLRAVLPPRDTVDAIVPLRLSFASKESRTMAKPAATAKKTKPLSKSEILNAISEAVGEEVSKKQVKEIVEALVAVAHKELKKSGIFVLHGLAKFVVVKKPAKPARKGINPFTKQEQVFAAKPASKSVRARPVKAVKDAVG